MVIKKILMTSAAFCLLALTVTVFQMTSCKKAEAQTGGSGYTLPPATTSTLGGVIIGAGLTVNSSGVLSTAGLTQLNLILFTKIINAQSSSRTFEIWLANIDGSNQHNVPVTLPSGFSYNGTSRLSPNGNKIIFTARNSAFVVNIYSCNIDGSNVTPIINGDGTSYLQVDINGVY